MSHTILTHTYISIIQLSQSIPKIIPLANHSFLCLCIVFEYIFYLSEIVAEEMPAKALFYFHRPQYVIWLLYTAGAIE